MSENKHTPGPWKWINGEKPTHKELVQVDLYEEGVDSILYHGADWPMDEANARLIAAAPQTKIERDALLEACKADDEWLRENIPAVNRPASLDAKRLVAIAQAKKE